MYIMYVNVMKENEKDIATISTIIMIHLIQNLILVFLNPKKTCATHVKDTRTLQKVIKKN